MVNLEKLVLGRQCSWGVLTVSWAWLWSSEGLWSYQQCDCLQWSPQWYPIREDGLVAVSGKSRVSVIIQGTKRKRVRRTWLLIAPQDSWGHNHHLFWGCKVLWRARWSVMDFPGGHKAFSRLPALRYVRGCLCGKIRHIRNVRVKHWDRRTTRRVRPSGEGRKERGRIALQGKGVSCAWMPLDLEVLLWFPSVSYKL